MINKFRSNRKTVLMMDDEPHNLQFAVEYIESKNLKVVISKSLVGVLRALKSNRYRFCLFDLSVPLSPGLKAAVKSENALYLQYPGLYAALQARNGGHQDFQVIIYSVHDTPEITAEAARIGLTYITKGRVRMLKDHIDGLVKARYTV